MTATKVIRDMVDQDFASGALVATADGHVVDYGSAVARVRGWRSAAAEAGDLATVEAIDAMGIQPAAEAYAALADERAVEVAS